MKKLFTLIALSAACAAAFAQVPPIAVGSESLAVGTATNQGVVTTTNFAINSAAQPTSTRTKIDNNTAPALGTIVQSQAVQGTCDSAGIALGGSAKGGGALISFPGETEEGCDAGRDLNMIVYVETVKDESLRAVLRMRACAKDTIHRAYVEADLADLCKISYGKKQDARRAESIASGQPDPGVAPYYKADDEYVAKRQRAAMRAQ